MIGIISNFVDYFNIIVGVIVVYDKYKYKFDNNDYWGRDYDVNIYFLYKLNKNLFIVGFGYF